MQGIRKFADEIEPGRESLGRNHLEFPSQFIVFLFVYVWINLGGSHPL